MRRAYIANYDKWQRLATFLIIMAFVCPWTIGVFYIGWHVLNLLVQLWT